MLNLSFNDINEAKFSLYENNPIIKNPLSSFVIADPCVLTPDESHDKKWHLFCHTFFGVYHYESDDGISFKNCGKIVKRAMRPNINCIDGRYYLFYERTKPVICNALTLLGAKWKSEIYCVESENFKEWTKPRLVLGQTRDFERDENGSALSNPFLIKTEDDYRLYYSCGQTFIKDCGFCEPRHISFAESKNITDGYLARTKPIISPDKNIEWLNLCSGCLKVYRLKDCYIGLQNGIFEKGGKSHSAIMLLKSDDGEKFEFVKPFLVPQKCGKSNWMAQYVYACCLTYYDNRLRLYFNARNVSNNLTGRESIGIFEAEI
ncbi:MAG: glycosyl hydrolase family 43 [Ruminococcaceae bacterium]|nr:glycosyl hydrolase family 43 [Oscillospiraceae bacterium]